MLFLGLDCGGSSSRALARDERGESRYEGQSGPANWASTPREELRRHLREATRGFPRPDAVCGCFAGLLTDQDRRACEQELESLFPGARVEARPDTHAALAACPDFVDACVIAGTGSAVFSWAGAPFGDRVVRSGGGGYLLGDHGSGFRYGLAVVKEFFTTQGDRADERLRRRVAKVFGSTEPDAMAATLYRQPSPAAFLAQFATDLALEARRGEAYALATIEEETQRLAATVGQHLSRHARSDAATPYRVFVTGGLWKSDPIYLHRFTETTTALLAPRILLIENLETPAVEGAARLAQRLCP